MEDKENIYTEPNEATAIDMPPETSDICENVDVEAVITETLPETEQSEDVEFEEAVSEKSDGEEESSEEESSEEESSEDDDPEKPKFFEALKSVPLNVLLLGSRTLLAAILVVIAAFTAIPHTAKLVLEIAAICVSFSSIIVYSAKDILKKNYFSDYLILTVITLITALTSKRLYACIIPLVFEAGELLFKYLYEREIDDVNESIVDIAESDAAFYEHLDAVSGEITNREGQSFDKSARIIKLVSLVVLAFGAVLCLFPPLFDGFDFEKWALRGVSVAVTAVFGQLIPIFVLLSLKCVTASFKNGIVFKSVKSLIDSARVSSVFFNKSGIITTGEYKVINVDPVRISESELLFLAAYCEYSSNHQIARAIVDCAGVDIDSSRITKFSEEQGMGCIIQFDGTQIIAAGNYEFMEKLGVNGEFTPGSFTSVYIAVGRTYIGRIDLADNIRPEASEVVSALRSEGVANIALMTGDNSVVATKIGREIGISEVYADYQLHDKIARMQYLLGTEGGDDRMANIGDGKRNAELLQLSDVGIAITNGDADVSEYADIIIDDKSISPVPSVFRIAKQHRKSINITMLCTVLSSLVLIFLSVIGTVNVVLVVFIEMIIQIALLYISRLFKFN